MSQFIALTLSVFLLLPGTRGFASQASGDAAQCAEAEQKLQEAKDEAQREGCDGKNLANLKRTLDENKLMLSQNKPKLEKTTTDRDANKEDIRRLESILEQGQHAGTYDVIGTGGADPRQQQALEAARQKEPELDRQFDDLTKEKDDLEKRQTETESLLNKAIAKCERTAPIFVEWCNKKSSCEKDLCAQQVNDHLKASAAEDDQTEAVMKKMKDDPNSPKTASEAKAYCEQNVPCGTNESKDSCTKRRSGCLEGISKSYETLAGQQERRAQAMDKNKKACSERNEKAASLCGMARQFVEQMGSIPETRHIAAQSSSAIKSIDEDRSSTITDYNQKIDDYKSSLISGANLQRSYAASTSATGVSMDPFAGGGFTNMSGGGFSSPSPGGGASPVMASPVTGGGGGSPTASSTPTASGATAPSSANNANAAAASANGAAAATTAALSPTSNSAKSASTKTTPSTQAMQSGLPTVTPLSQSGSWSDPTATQRRTAENARGDESTAAASARTAGAETPAEIASTRHGSGGTPANSFPITGQPMGGFAPGVAPQGATASATAAGAPTLKGSRSGGGSGGGVSSGGVKKRYFGRTYIRRADGSMITLEEYKDRIAAGEKMADVDLRQFQPQNLPPERTVAGQASASNAVDFAARAGKYENGFLNISNRYQSLTNPLDPDLPPPSK